jgi:hypothetical protein
MQQRCSQQAVRHSLSVSINAILQQLCTQAMRISSLVALLQLEELMSRNEIL